MMMYPDSHSENPVAAVQALLKGLLANQLADAVLVQSGLPWSKLPMHALITDPEKLSSADPLAPAASVSGARQAVSVTRNATGKKVALVLRPCEIRALIELAKLNQCDLTDTIIVGMECLGRMENGVYADDAEKTPDLTLQFLKDPALQGKITETCASCDAFIPENADIILCVLGTDGIGFRAGSDKGKGILSALGFSEGKEPDGKDIEALLNTRQRAKQQRFDETTRQLSSIDGFQSFIARCLNCYNCRSACPVCYCKECVFLTDVFAHPPELLLERAQRRGMVKLPADTSMFHMTRLSHIGHACVGCGQCTSVCPSGIKVADMFRSISEKTQAFYGYQPGRDINEPIPQLAVRKDG